MPQSLARIWLHITFSTGERRAYLQNPDVRDEMFRMLSHQAKSVDCQPLRAGGWIDHVHLLCGLSRTITVAKLLEHVKVKTSKWAKKRLPDLSTFHWQAGYGVFSVSQSQVEQVVAYIEGQAEHHRTKTFQEEFRALCDRHGIEIDERYAWD